MGIIVFFDLSGSVQSDFAVSDKANRDRERPTTMS